MNGGSKIIVIGAGPAGISCAYQLAKYDISSLIVEKENVSGGICKTIEYKGFRFDIGGHRFFTKSKIIENIWQSFLKDDFLRRKRYSRIYFDKKLFVYPLRTFDVFSKIGIWQSMVIFCEYLCSRLFCRNHEEVSFKDWIIKRFGRRVYEMFFKTYTEKIWGMPCEEISYEWAAQRIKDLSVFSVIKNALFFSKKGKIKTLIDEFYYPKYGAGQMYEKILNYVIDKGASISYSTVPKEIEVNNKKVTSIALADREGRINRVGVDYLVSSMPFADIFSLLQPLPPENILKAAARLRRRSFLEVCLIVKGKCRASDQWIYIQDSNIAASRIQIYKNWSPCMASGDNACVNLGVEYFCSLDDDLWERDDSEIIRLAEVELLKLGIFKKLEVKDGFVVRVPHAYPVYAGSYKEDILILKDYIEKIENLQAIGRCGMHRYNNMDHSMLTGIYAARNIIEGKRNYNVWEINEDRDYLERVN